jgi:hypothetical protein
MVFLLILTLYLNSVYERERYFVVWYFIAEETAFMDLLQYMYSLTLRARSTKELLDVLMLADKFEVTSCVDWCSTTLQDSPMSMENALVYIDLPRHLHTNDSVKSLIDKAKKFLLQLFRDIER